jgi:membrane-associated protease RseP (regulator of RpoE activity)
MDQQAAPVPPKVRVRGRFFAKDRTWLNGLLFLLTTGSAFLVGLDWSLAYLTAGLNPPPIAGGVMRAALRDPRAAGLSVLYAVVLMLILSAHEMGHYLTCRRYGISATLPFFIPAPTLIGTMGAFIKIRDPITRKRQLFDIGAAGPLAGFVLAVPALAVGLAFSKVVPALPRGEAIVFGEPLIVKLIGWLALRGAGPGFDVVLHPVAFAGWVGMLVTALNLFPMGQLDGGHVAYAVFGRRSRRLAQIFVAFFAVMGALFWLGWWVWALLILVLGLKHPPVWDEPYPLDRGRTIVAAVLVLIFVLCFIPAPVKGLNLMNLLHELGLK